MALKTVIMFASVLIVMGAESGTKAESDVTGREIREYMPETWHAIQKIPEGATGWIPRDSPDNLGVVSTTKRRRLRKRKRRPPIVSYLDQNLGSVVVEDNAQTSPELSLPLTATRHENDDSQYGKRRTKPSGAADPWGEVPEESVRPYIRRKVTPAYSEELTVINNDNPFSATIQFGPDSTSNSDSESSGNSDKTSTTITRKPPNLKEILKQNGGLSLSEILQRKNITLAELLMGKEEAINALTEASDSAVVSTTSRSSEVETVDTVKYKRLPPSIALRKDSINRRYEQFAESHEALSDKEMMEAQRKRLALLQGHNYKSGQHGKFSDVTRYEVITEPTTERRIFVPSHPQLYTSIVYKPDLEHVTAKTESSFTTAPQKVNSNKSKARLPITSAKLMKMTSKKSTTSPKGNPTGEIEEENYPKVSGQLSKPLKISVKDVFGFKTSENEPEQKTSDEPLRMSIDLDAIVDTKPTPSATPMSSTTTTMAPTQHTSVSTEEAPKLKPYTAKEEILEILKDPLGREGLARILEARNMTIQELIEQRERGSSQLHLADIFHNKTREPEPSDEPLEGKISSEVFTNFPVFTRKPKVLINEDLNSSQGRRLVVTAFPSFKIEVDKEPQRAKEPFPWQQLYPYLFPDENQNNDGIAPTVQQILQQGNSKAEPALAILTEEDIQRLDQKVYSAISNEQLNLVDENSQRIFNVSSGVKSAIVASLLIVGLSMIVFVTILFLFRWSQRRKKRLRYGDSLKPPLFNVKRRNIKSFVAETLGKKNVNYYKRHLQSMSDDIWDKENDRKNVF